MKALDLSREHQRFPSESNLKRKKKERKKERKEKEKVGREEGSLSDWQSLCQPIEIGLSFHRMEKISVIIKMIEYFS